jgi:peptidoglycan/xylan/chitin deacetylase (PgdA/CDA1 family)
MLRRVLRAAASTRTAAAAASLLDRAGGPAPICAILTYHRVLDPESNPTTYPGLCVRPAQLRVQLAELARRYPIIGLSDLLAARRGEASLPSRSVLVTFDDAYVDFATAAWPILSSLSLPATLFVPTEFPGRPDRTFWWERLFELVSRAEKPGVIDTPAGRLRTATPEERLGAYRRLRAHATAAGHAALPGLLDQLAAAVDAPPPRSPVLGWDELRRLAAEGVALAPHSRTHRLLPELDDEELRDELEGSRADLQRKVGEVPPVIAYPSGAHDARVRHAARAAGYEIAFTTRRGVHRLRDLSWLAVRRINVGLQANPRLVTTQIDLLSALARADRAAGSVAARQRGW